MTNVSSERINQAIRECLDRCYVAYDPVLCLTEYLRDLSRQQWSAADISEVRSRVIHILRAVAVDESDDDSH